MSTGILQQRGSAVPAGNDLVTTINALTQALGLNGSNSNSSFIVRDAAGNPRVNVGYLPSGDYGILLSAPNNSENTELLPIVTQFWLNAIIITSTSFVTNTNLPAVSAYIGASGNCLVRISSVININDSGNIGEIKVQVDGNSGNQQGTCAFTQTGGTEGSASCLAEFPYAAAAGNSLTPNSYHTFQLVFKSNDGSAVDFSYISLTIQPI